MPKVVFFDETEDPNYVCFRLKRLRNASPEDRLRLWRRVLREVGGTNDGDGFSIMNGEIVETNWYAWIPRASQQTAFTHLKTVGIVPCD